MSQFVYPSARRFSANPVLPPIIPRASRKPNGLGGGSGLGLGVGSLRFPTSDTGQGLQDGGGTAMVGSALPTIPLPDFGTNRPMGPVSGRLEFDVGGLRFPVERVSPVI